MPVLRFFSCFQQISRKITVPVWFLLTLLSPFTATFFGATALLPLLDLIVELLTMLAWRRLCRLRPLLFLVFVAWATIFLFVVIRTTNVNTIEKRRICRNFCSTPKNRYIQTQILYYVVDGCRTRRISKSWITFNDKR